MKKAIKILIIGILLFTIVSCSEIGNIGSNINEADKILEQNINKHYGEWIFQKAVLRAERKAGNWWDCHLYEVDYDTSTIFFGCYSPFIEWGLNWTYDYKKIGVIINSME